MHPINKLLRYAGFTVHPLKSNAFRDKGFARQYREIDHRLRESKRSFQLFAEPMLDDNTPHPNGYIDYECAFAASHLRRSKPVKTLDIGSYRQFIAGLLAYHEVTTLDIRTRDNLTDGETVLICDVKRIPLADETFDAVVSLCALEHFGLGRYGDKIDLEADEKAMHEILRVLKPGGTLIFTTTMTRAEPSIAFNAHRIYSREQIGELVSGLMPVEEKFFSMERQAFCSLTETTARPRSWDVYMGAWKK